MENLQFSSYKLMASSNWFNKHIWPDIINIIIKINIDNSILDWGDWVIASSCDLIVCQKVPLEDQIPAKTYQTKTLPWFPAFEYILHITHFYKTCSFLYL